MVLNFLPSIILFLSPPPPSLPPSPQTMIIVRPPARCSTLIELCEQLPVVMDKIAPGRIELNWRESS